MILLYVTHRKYGEGPREWTNLIIMGFVANLKTTPWAESWSKFLKFWFTGGRWRCEETKINNRNLRHWKGGTDRSIVSVPMDVVFRHLFTVDHQLLNRIGQWLYSGRRGRSCHTVCCRTWVLFSCPRWAFLDERRWKWIRVLIEFG